MMRVFAMARKSDFFPNKLSKKGFRVAWFVAILSFLLPGLAPAVPSADGLYATFQTTEGTFTIELAFEKAPMTVANFVGLAEGSRAWVDFEKGQASTEPFFDGLKIPRADPGFVIQMGSPDNTVGGGPGYRFGDEFHPDLTHAGPGIVSMANSGANTNGSQFFITLAAATSLDRKHAVFGSVVEGLDIVQAIGLLAGGTVTIQSVTITRTGAAATAFDVSAWGLPVVKKSSVELDATAAPAAFFLNYLPEPFTQYYGFNSTDLNQWGETFRDSFVEDLSVEPVDVTAQVAGQDQHFFKLIAADYVSVPASLNGSTLELSLISSNPDQILTMNFTGEPRSQSDYDNPLGIFTIVTDGEADLSGGIGAYYWSKEYHRARLGILLEGFVDPFYFLTSFRPDGTGVFTGYRQLEDSSGPFPYYGGLTLTNTPP